MFVKTLVATLCVIGVALAEQSPVFLWGSNSPAKPSLQTVPQTEFAGIISELLNDHMIVAFQEDGLSANDFLCANAETSQSCYAHLQGVQSKNYYASVENPTEAIRAAASEREFNTVAENGKLETPVECSVGKAVIVSFEKSNKLRDAQLEAHDAAIAAISRSMSCPTVYLYMPAPSTVGHKRKRRSIAETAAPHDGYLFREDSQFLLFYTKFYFVDNGKQEEVFFNGDLTIKNSTTVANQFSVSLTGNNSKTLSFGIAYSIDGYYTMSNVTYNNISFYSSAVNAPRTFSYFCGNLTLNAATSNADGSPYSILWNSLQFQAPFGSTANTSFVFGDPWHCVGFFTPGILSGLFVVILLLAIIFTGVCWMMDINTMDRFDDPKGKTITINTSE